MAKSARKPVKAAPKKAPAKAKKAAPAKKPAKTAPHASFAPTDPETLAAQLAQAAGIGRDELLTRALKAFAAAHGIALESEKRAETKAETIQAPARASPPAPTIAAPAAPAEPRPEPQEGPALSAEKRLFIHGIGRPPIEMIADSFFIGSSPRSDLWVNSTGIETRHLRIDRGAGGKYYASDLNTAKGTVLHGQPVGAQVEIKHEDTFYLAGYHRVRMYVIDGA